MSERSRANEETQRYRTLLEMNNALVANLTRDALFHAIAGALRRVVPFERTAILLHDPDKSALKLHILESSLTSSYFSVGLEMTSGESHVGQVFQRQTPLLVRDLATDRRYPADDMAYGDGVRSYVTYPSSFAGRAWARSPWRARRPSNAPWPTWSSSSRLPPRSRSPWPT